MNEQEKRAAYRSAHAEVGQLIGATADPVSDMASVCAVLHQHLRYASWTGFYRVVAPGLLRIGPYQGPVGCLEIPFERGVCGAAARRRATVVVENVHDFDGHIACDPRARSEIVVPVFDERDELVAVLDVDSREEAAFDAVDRQELEQLVRLLRPSFTTG